MITNRLMRRQRILEIFKTRKLRTLRSFFVFVHKICL
nr:MAG TPA: hypothetical protein [Caudoviricetes sp.]